MEGPSSEDDGEDEGEGVQATGDCESALKHRGDLELDGVVGAGIMVVVVVEGEEVETVVVVVVVPRIGLDLVVCSWEDVELDTDVLVLPSRREIV